MTSTTSRLLLVLSLLQARRDWPGQILADRLEISRRTVRRDVDRLREMGYHIVATTGPDGGYRLDSGAELPPLLFDDDQAVALAIALQGSTAAAAGMEESALRALTTLRQVMPSRLRRRLDAVQFTAMADHPGSAPGSVSPEVLIALSTAIRNREVVRCDYARPAGPESSAARRIEPHHIVAAQGRWYLVGWDLDHDGWRIFRVDRLSPRTPTGPRFTPREIPGGSVHDFVSARFKGSDQLNAWPCTGAVVLSLPAGEVLPFAGEGTVEDLGPHRCRLTAGSWSWVSLAAAMGRFDADIHEVEPPQLAHAFAQLARRYAAADAAAGA